MHLFENAIIVLNIQFGYQLLLLRSCLIFPCHFLTSAKNITRSLRIFLEQYLMNSIVLHTTQPLQRIVSRARLFRGGQGGGQALLVKAKVRGTITCDECKKPRCVYSHTRLSTEALK